MPTGRKSRPAIAPRRAVPPADRAVESKGRDSAENKTLGRPAGHPPPRPSGPRSGRPRGGSPRRGWPRGGRRRGGRPGRGSRPAGRPAAGRHRAAMAWARWTARIAIPASPAPSRSAACRLQPESSTRSIRAPRRFAAKRWRARRSTSTRCAPCRSAPPRSAPRRSTAMRRARRRLTRRIARPVSEPPATSTSSKARSPATIRSISSSARIRRPPPVPVRLRPVDYSGRSIGQRNPCSTSLRAALRPAGKTDSGSWPTRAAT